MSTNAVRITLILCVTVVVLVIVTCGGAILLAKVVPPQPNIPARPTPTAAASPQAS